MATITGAELQAIMNLSDTDLPHTNAESLIDFAIDSLNLYGAGLSNLGGTTPNKTLTVTSKQRAGILLVVRKCYYGAYKHLENVSIAGLSVSLANFMDDPAFLESVKRVAYQLKSVTFTVAEDTSEIDE